MSVLDNEELHGRRTICRTPRFIPDEHPVKALGVTVVGCSCSYNQVLEVMGAGVTVQKGVQGSMQFFSLYSSPPLRVLVHSIIWQHVEITLCF